jgi:hypothetical protein
MDLTTPTQILPEAVKIERERFAVERAVAERAYDTAQTLIDTVGTKRWISPGEFIELVRQEGNVSTYYAQMALGNFREQGLVESVPGLGVRALVLDADFEDKEPLQFIEGSAPEQPIPYYGTAHWDY